MLVQFLPNPSANSANLCIRMLCWAYHILMKTEHPPLFHYGNMGCEVSKRALQEGYKIR